MSVRIFHGQQCIATSAEVWVAIHARHHNDLEVVSSFSDPGGTFNGGPGIVGCIETMYGLKGADLPLVGAKTTWKIDQEKPYQRNEAREYWLVLAMKESA